MALELQSELRQLIWQRTQSLRERWPEARWVQPQHLHLTLRFLGESSPAQQQALLPLLQQMSGSFPAFPLTLKGLGSFGGKRRPPVLWAGAQIPPGLQDWVQALNDRLEELGYPRETRPYQPHLTLARWRSPARLGSLDAGLQLGHQPVLDFVLISSRLTPDGPIYTLKGRFPGSTA